MDNAHAADRGRRPRTTRTVLVLGAALIALASAVPAAAGDDAGPRIAVVILTDIDRETPDVIGDDVQAVVSYVPLTQVDWADEASSWLARTYTEQVYEASLRDRLQKRCKNCSFERVDLTRLEDHERRLLTDWGQAAGYDGLLRIRLDLTISRRADRVLTVRRGEGRAAKTIQCAGLTTSAVLHQEVGLHDFARKIDVATVQAAPDTGGTGVLPATEQGMQDEWPQLARGLRESLEDSLPNKALKAFAAAELAGIDAEARADARVRLDRARLADEARSWVDHEDAAAIQVFLDDHPDLDDDLRAPLVERIETLQRREHDRRLQAAREAERPATIRSFLAAYPDDPSREELEARLTDLDRDARSARIRTAGDVDVLFDVLRGEASRDDVFAARRRLEKVELCDEGTRVLGTDLCVENRDSHNPDIVSRARLSAREDGQPPSHLRAEGYEPRAGDIIETVEGLPVVDLASLNEALDGFDDRDVLWVGMARIPTEGMLEPQRYAAELSVAWLDEQKVVLGEVWSDVADMHKLISGSRYGMKAVPCMLARDDGTPWYALLVQVPSVITVSRAHDDVYVITPQGRSYTVAHAGQAPLGQARMVVQTADTGAYRVIDADDLSGRDVLGLGFFNDDATMDVLVRNRRVTSDDEWTFSVLGFPPEGPPVVSYERRARTYEELLEAESGHPEVLARFARMKQNRSWTDPIEAPFGELVAESVTLTSGTTVHKANGAVFLPMWGHDTDPVRVVGCMWQRNGKSYKHDVALHHTEIVVKVMTVELEPQRRRR